MWKVRPILWGALLLVAVAWPTLAAEEKKEPSKEDRTELRLAQRQLHSRDDAQRIEGIERLGAMRGVEAAKVIAAVGLVDGSVDVRRAAYPRWRPGRTTPKSAHCWCGRSAARRGRRNGPSPPPCR